MLYHKPTTLDHPLAGKYPVALVNLNTLIVEEGGRHSFKGVVDYLIINLDSVAKNQRSGNTLSTMDFAFGIADERERSPRMVLTDFKFRQKEPKNFGRAALDSKVSGSTQLMGHSIPIEKKYYLVIPPNKVSQAQADLRRLYKLKSPFEAIGIEAFLAKFFDLVR